ncbi:MAG: molybdenum cofactor biosynthesis protein MoaE [Flavobacteriaceae bacterium]|nr:molybdenum cofactor biosynthesis protein MoaE [Flavobacteriaceae bacterium]
MEIKEMTKIAETALEQFNIKKVAIHHAEGLLAIGDIPVIIAVSSPHKILLLRPVCLRLTR